MLTSIPSLVLGLCYRFAQCQANWHTELQSCNGKKTKVVGAHDQGVKVRYSTVGEAGAWQVLVHIPKRAKTLLKEVQQEQLAEPVVGEEMPTRPAAKDMAALKCVEKLLNIGALNDKFRPVPPACVLVLCPSQFSVQTANQTAPDCQC